MLKSVPAGSAIHFAEHDVDAAQDRHDIGNHRAAALSPRTIDWYVNRFLRP